MTTMMKQSTVGGQKKQEEHRLYSSYQSHKTNHLIINSMVSVMTLIWKLNAVSSNC